MFHSGRSAISSRKGAATPWRTASACILARARVSSCSAFRSARGLGPQVTAIGRTRSEEHTSELQSRLHLVCRLLLEKKKKTQSSNLVFLCPTALKQIQSIIVGNATRSYAGSTVLSVSAAWRTQPCSDLHL